MYSSFRAVGVAGGSVALSDSRASLVFFVWEVDVAVAVADAALPVFTDSLDALIVSFRVLLVGLLSVFAPASLRIRICRHSALDGLHTAIFSQQSSMLFGMKLIWSVINMNRIQIFAESVAQC
jgi:hypothetical protein